MRTIMVMFDTLTRKFLPSYGCNWTKLPNFKRLEQRCTTFDNFYAGSLPCMPARRELHTGKHNFLHRSWGPLEPVDRSKSCVRRASIPICVQTIRTIGKTVAAPIITAMTPGRASVDRRATALWRTISRWTCRRNAIPSIRLVSP